MIAPGGSESISILLVEKDKQILLQSYERLCQSGLDDCKDKFLVQSFAVGSSFAAKASGDSAELYDALTSMWNRVTSSSASLHNKKLHVRHMVNSAPDSNLNKMALETDPELEMKFTLSHKEATPRCMLTLRHPGTTDEHLAFKVRITP